MKALAADLNIHVEESAIRSIMNKWFNFRTVSNLPKSNGLTKITECELNLLNRAVYRDRGLTARKLKNLLN